jgi:hypothetical protein
MIYRAIIVGIDNDFSYLIVKNAGNWIDFQGRSYRKVQEANGQVTEKSGQVKGIVETIYFEGNPVPINCDLDPKEATLQIFKEVHSSAFAQPQTSLWNKLFKKS